VRELKRGQRAIRIGETIGGKKMDLAEGGKWMRKILVVGGKLVWAMQEEECFNQKGGIKFGGT